MNTGKLSFRQLYDQTGCVVLNTGLASELAAIRKKCIEVFSLAAVHNGLAAITDDAGVSKLREPETKNVWDAGYHQLKYLPEIHHLCAHSEILEIAKTLRITSPSLCGMPVVRVDVPGEKKRILGAHQDYPYHYGSIDAVTLWLPLQDITEDIGPVEMVKCSHTEGVVESEDGIIRDESLLSSLQFRKCPVALGQVVAFSQMAIHRSSYNASNKIRFSLQIRFNNLDSAEYGRRLFFVNEGSTQKFIRQ